MQPGRNKRVAIVVAGAVGLVGVIALVGLGARRVVAPPPGPSAVAPSPAGQGATGATPAAVVYDPTKLLENGVPAAEVYDKEPRSAGWAEAAELVVGGAMGRDLRAMVPEAQVVIKCRTLSCLVGIDAPPEKREAALAVTKFLMLAPWVVDLEPEEDGTMRWLFFQEPRFGDPKTFVDWFEGVRKRTLGDIHAGKAPNPFPVALEQVPKD
jgi:hypothetical protein